MPLAGRRRAVPVVMLASTMVLGACAFPFLHAPDRPTVSVPATPIPSASGASAGPTAADPALAAFYSQHLAWHGCGGSFECASLRVPLSYDDPAGKSIDLQVIRLPASDPSSRIGSLVMNPGGPGGSGIDYARAARGVTSDGLRQHYDIVGFDPRGVGTSDPIHCQTDLQTDAFTAADATPDSPAEVSILADISAQVGAGCQAKSPQLISHMGTADVARDMDILRAALGDDHLSYLGKSYGTAIGTAYAELFPSRVGRMVLDGALDPSLDATGDALGQAKGFEMALRRFVEKCPTLDGCPLSNNPDAAMVQMKDFFARLDATPLSTNQNQRVLNESLAVLGVVGSLYDNVSEWPTLAQALGSAFKGDGSDLLDAVDYYTDRGADGHYTSNANDAIYAVNCWDKPATPNVTQTEALATQWAKIAPIMGPYLAWGNLPCSTWPVHSSVAPHRVDAAGSPPILVVGTTYDPATPVEWARSLSSQLSKGVYLEWVGDGHTAYYRDGGSACINSAVDTYLLTGKPPANGTVCH